MGLLLRGALVGIESPWYDEVISLKHLGADSLSIYPSGVNGESSPAQPLYFVLEYCWGSLFGAGVMAQRWLSVLLAEVSLILVYLIGHRIQGTVTGFLAALALASSAVHIEYSLEVRMYMLTLVWALVSVYSLLRVLDGAGKIWWGTHCVTTVALVWTHAFGVFLLLVEAVACVVWGKRCWKWQGYWFGGQFLAAGSLAFWFLNARGKAIDEAMTWLPLPTFWLNDTSLWVSLVGTWYTWLVSSEFQTGLFDVRNAIPFLVYGGLAIGAMVFAAIRLRGQSERDGNSEGTVLWLAAWWLLPSLLLYLLSHAWQPAFFPRYVLYCMVPPFLMSGWLVSQISLARWRAGTIAALVLLSLGMGYANSREPYRAPWEWVLAEIEVGEGIGVDAVR